MAATRPSLSNRTANLPSPYTGVLPDGLSMTEADWHLETSHFHDRKTTRVNTARTHPESPLVEDPASPTVLLVEDEQDCRWLWRMLLDGDERFGHVTEAGSSREAIDVLLREYPDIVITDVRMPGRSGLDVVDFLHSRYPMPIVVVTSASNDVADLAIEHGATAFWTKIESVSPEMSEQLWCLWQHEKPSAKADPPCRPDAVPRDRPNRPGTGSGHRQ